MFIWFISLPLYSYINHFNDRLNILRNYNDSICR
nr:MAG TPA: hypothetical protein [Caudoviricetes sp.]